MDTIFFLDEEIVGLASELTYLKDDVLFVQYEKADQIFLLIEGHLCFYGNAAGQHILIGQTYSPNTLVGLSPLHSPFRHEIEVQVASNTATVLKWNHRDLRKFLESSLEKAQDFYRFVNTQAHSLIEDSSELFLSMTGAGKALKPNIFLAKGVQSRIEQDEVDSTLFLLNSPFFEVFDEEDLRILATSMRRIQYAAGDVIYLQGGACSGIDVLESGEIQFSRNNLRPAGEQTVWFRSISTPGYLLGSSGILNQISDMTVTVSKDAVVYHLPIEVITSLQENDIHFGLKLQRRVSWLLMNQLRMVQARLLSSEFQEETLVVTNLIKNNQARLRIDSPLHVVPHLLKEKLTIKQGLNLLHQVELSSNSSERNLASLSLDNLHETQKERSFFEGLMNIYSSVVSAPASLKSEDLRERCNRAARQAFSIPSVKLKGYTNLPENAGHVFIYNHLLNDPYYTLPNQFQITLDAHYLSMLLYEKYGKSAMRIVRIGRESEYAHEDYYERLNFPNVYTKESRRVTNLDQQKQIKREELFVQLEKIISNGANVIISPEGTSYPTDQSPGKFKTGIFRMVMEMTPEPLIVPLVVANFDQRIPKNTFLCEVREPFKISERVAGEFGGDLKEFLSSYQKVYKGYIQHLLNNPS